MVQHLENLIARDVLRLALQLAPGLIDQGTHPGAAPLPRDKQASLFDYRRRLIALDRRLTDREIDVCTRSLLGMTAEGTAIDLGIKKTSVVTYRKRAYERLGISSQSELFRLIS